MLSVLGATLPAKITVNELTTVASAFTSARFINGEAISGNPLGLRIAAGNAPNLVDPATGSWGKVILDPINITLTLFDEVYPQSKDGSRRRAQYLRRNLFRPLIGSISADPLGGTPDHAVTL